jgi:hypothetical protein
MEGEATELVIDGAAEPETVEVAEVVEEITEAEPEPEEVKVEFTPEQQAKVDEIARKAAARNAEKLQEKIQALQQAEAELAKYRPQQQQAAGRPPVPPVPDPFEDGYEAKLSARDEALSKAAQWDAVQAITALQRQEQAKVQAEAGKAEVEKVLTSYTNRAHKLGIKDAELSYASGQIESVGIHGDLVEFILQDTQGPALTVYLGNNPDELDKIKGMSATRAAIYLETQIKPKAARQPKKPPPATLDPVRGSGYREGQLGGKGLVIE